MSNRHEEVIKMWVLKTALKWVNRNGWKAPHLVKNNKTFAGLCCSRIAALNKSGFGAVKFSGRAFHACKWKRGNLASVNLMECFEMVISWSTFNGLDMFRKGGGHKAIYYLKKFIKNDYWKMGRCSSSWNFCNLVV